jgi:uncharacterized protein YcfJ
MKKAFGVLFFVPVVSLAQSYAEVIRVEPRMVTKQHLHCQEVQVRTDNSGVGTVIGGVAGGIIGNQVGKGSGRDAATVAGAVVGGIVGNRIGQDQGNYITRQHCSTVPVTVQQGEIVTFRYQGRIFTYTFE